MYVGDPNRTDRPSVAEGVGYARSSDDHRKGKSGRSEGERPLGIPTVRDRIAQTVCKMILEPIFEADFEDCSYGFRPDQSTKYAIPQSHL